MKLISLRCTSCGAELEVDPERSVVFCSYCGTKLLIDDESIRITNRIVDEARLREAEVRLKELEYAHERELREETIRQEQKKSFRLAVIAYVCALAVSYLIPWLREYAILVFVFGGIALISLRSGDRRSNASGLPAGTSSRSKGAAALLCFFFGVFGAHYFYVRRIGMGFLYLCTFGLFGIGYVIDIIRILCGTFRDSEGRYLR
ncbi:MAG: NINE protein [Blautia sp.]|nr:NINE protein [Blautia sp.]